MSRMPSEVTMQFRYNLPCIKEDLEKPMEPWEWECSHDPDQKFPVPFGGGDPWGRSLTPPSTYVFGFAIFAVYVCGLYWMITS